MPIYEDSDLLLTSDNVEIIIQGQSLPRVTDTWDSDLLLTSDNVEIIMQGDIFTRIGILGSDLLLTSDNIDYLVKGISLIPPIDTVLRQIYSDGTHVYGATEKGLVVFKP